MNNYNQPVRYDFIPHYKGDGLRKIAMVLKYPQTGNPVNIEGAKIRMQLRAKFVGKIAWEFSTLGDGDSLLVITDGLNGKFEFPRMNSWGIIASKYDYDIEITHADGFVCTYVRGTWAINQDITNGSASSGTIQGGMNVSDLEGLQVEQEVVEILIEVNYQEKGDKGDAFTYEDFTPQQIELLQKPALDAAEIANEAANSASTAADSANGATQDAITATQESRQATDESTQSNEASILATQNAVTATNNAITATSNANTATNNANEAALAANEAASVANSARGWSPLAMDEADGERIVRKLTGYIGGTGDEPTDNVGLYFKGDGTFTNVKAEAQDYRGIQGLKGDSVQATVIFIRDDYNQIPVPRDPNTLYFISNDA